MTEESIIRQILIEKHTTDFLTDLSAKVLSSAQSKISQVSWAYTFSLVSVNSLSNEGTVLQTWTCEDQF